MWIRRLPTSTRSPCQTKNTLLKCRCCCGSGRAQQASVFESAVLPCLLAYAARRYPAYGIMSARVYTCTSS